MSRPASAIFRPPVPSADSPSQLRFAHVTVLVGAEIALLGLGVATGHLLAAAALAVFAAYFLVAFRAPGVAWALVWVVSPFSIEVTLGGGGAISLPTEPMIAASLVAWAMRSISIGGLRLPSSPMNLPLAALAAVALISVALSAYGVVGLKAWAVSAAYAAFGYLYFLTSPCDRSRRDIWIRLVVVSGAFWGLYGSVRLFALGVSPRLAYGIARPFFPEHGTYAAYLAMVLPLALLLALDRRGWARLGYTAAALAIGLGITLSFTRAAWLSLVVVLPIMAALWARGRTGWGGLALPALLAGAILVTVLGVGAARDVSRHAASVTEVENVSNLERLNRWIAAMEMTRDRPWFGVGYGAYAPAYAEYRRKLIVTEGSYQYMGAHSEPLRLLSETGVFGLGAALWLLWTAAGVGLRVFRKSADRDTRLLSLAIVLGLATYAVHGIFNSYLGYDKITVPFWVGLGAIAALGERPPRGEAVESLG